MSNKIKYNRTPRQIPSCPSWSTDTNHRHMAPNKKVKNKCMCPLIASIHQHHHEWYVTTIIGTMSLTKSLTSSCILKHSTCQIWATNMVLIHSSNMMLTEIHVSNWMASHNYTDICCTSKNIHWNQCIKKTIQIKWCITTCPCWGSHWHTSSMPLHCIYFLAKPLKKT